MNLGNRLAELRKKQELSQEEMAEILGVSRQTIYKWESGRAVPTGESLKAISTYFHISVDELIGTKLSSRTETTEEPPETEEKDGQYGLKQKIIYSVLIGLCGLSLGLGIGFRLGWWSNENVNSIVDRGPDTGITEWEDAGHEIIDFSKDKVEYFDFDEP